MFTFDNVAMAVLATIIIITLVEGYRYHNIRITEAQDDLRNAKARADDLEYALSDVVEKFGEPGGKMYTNTLDKLNSLSRARAVLSKAKA
ncbi:MAG: hypothetical protein ABW044_05400 [Cellvibrio sp.]